MSTRLKVGSLVEWKIKAWFPDGTLFIVVEDRLRGLLLRDEAAFIGMVLGTKAEHGVRDEWVEVIYEPPS